jgi:predicted GNAT family N-acyltransferase
MDAGTLSGEVAVIWPDAFICTMLFPYIAVIKNGVYRITTMALLENIQISKYTNNWRAACMNAFVSNVPEYFTEAEIAQFGEWLDLLQKGESASHYYVIASGNTLVGCGGFGYSVKDSAVSFAWGFVDRSFHKQGFGQLLLTYRLEKIKELYPDADIVLDTTQHSRTFFERYGFVTVKYTADGYAAGMHRYDMVLRDNAG